MYGSFFQYPPADKTNFTMVHEVADLDDFKSQLSSAASKLVVVDFHATWCGPCKMIAPLIGEMAETMSDVTFLKVDVDEAEDVSAEYNITAMPSFLFFKDGKKVEIEE
jgi:thioredoxin 1